MTNTISIELTGQEMHKLIKRLGHTGFIPYRLEDRRQLLIRLISELGEASDGEKTEA